MSVHIGTSGWSYDHWEGVLYPYGTMRRDRISYYVREYQTVELNSSFYKWPKPAAFKSWQRRLPGGFLLSVKAPRYLTIPNACMRLKYGLNGWLPAGTGWVIKELFCWYSFRQTLGLILTACSTFFRGCHPGCGWQWSFGTIAGMWKPSLIYWNITELPIAS